MIFINLAFKLYFLIELGRIGELDVKNEFHGQGCVMIVSKSSDLSQLKEVKNL